MPISRIIAKVRAQVRERVLRLFKRREWLSPEAMDARRGCGREEGFSLNAGMVVGPLLHSLLDKYKNIQGRQR